MMQFKKSMADEDQKLAKTPPNVIANAARFNRQFLDKQIGGNPMTVSIGKMLTVMGEQENTIRTLSRILGQEYNDQHLHDMHNSLFGGLVSGSGTGREGMQLDGILSQLISFIHQQHQQIERLIEGIRKKIDQVTNEVKSDIG